MEEGPPERRTYDLIHSATCRPCKKSKTSTHQDASMHSYIPNAYCVKSLPLVRLSSHVGGGE